MSNLPSSIPELESLLKNRSLSSLERRRIKKKLYKKKFPEKYKLERKRWRDRRKLNPEKSKKDSDYQKWYQKKYHKSRVKKIETEEQRLGKRLAEKRWRTKNKHKVRMFRHNRKKLEKTKLSNSVSSKEILEWENSWRNCDVVCSYCLSEIKGEKAHVEHIIPLSKSGQHEIWNLCISCQKCNRKKSDIPPYEFIKTIENEMFYNKFNPIPSFTNFLQLFLKDQDEFFRSFFGEFKRGKD